MYATAEYEITRNDGAANPRARRVPLEYDTNSAVNATPTGDLKRSARPPSPAIEARDDDDSVVAAARLILERRGVHWSSSTRHPSNRALPRCPTRSPDP